jgi:hypothetical protein
MWTFEPETNQRRILLRQKQLKKRKYTEGRKWKLRTRLLWENISYFHFLNFLLILLTITNKEIIDSWSEQLCAFSVISENTKKIVFIISKNASFLIYISSSLHHNGSLLESHIFLLISKLNTYFSKWK